MYASLTLTLSPPMRADEAANIIREKVVGSNSIDGEENIRATAVQFSSAINPAYVTVAEQISTVATIFYFTMGSDMFSIEIYAKSIPELRAQCARISRQLHDNAVKVKDSKASILVSENGSDIDILTGDKISKLRKFFGPLKDRFIDRIVPGAVIVFLSALIFGKTEAVKSADISLAATVVGALLYAIVVGVTTDSWNWRYSK